MLLQILWIGSETGCHISNILHINNGTNRWLLSGIYLILVHTKYRKEMVTKLRLHHAILQYIDNLFLAATKQLYKWYFPSVCPSVRLSVCPSVCPSVRLSVCPSVCHTFLTMFPSSYHHEIFRIYY